MSRGEPGAQGAKQALDAIYRMLSAVNDELIAQSLGTFSVSSIA